LPLNDTNIFVLGQKNSPEDTIVGFKPEVLANPKILRNYNSLDFSDLAYASIKYVDGACEFNVPTTMVDTDTGFNKKIFDV
jgi:hypothetical protein